MAASEQYLFMPKQRISKGYQGNVVLGQLGSVRRQGSRTQIPAETGSLRHFIFRLSVSPIGYSIVRYLAWVEYLAAILGLLYHCGWVLPREGYIISGGIIFLLKNYTKRHGCGVMRDAWVLWDEFLVFAPHIIFFTIIYLPKCSRSAWRAFVASYISQLLLVSLVVIFGSMYLKLELRNWSNIRRGNLYDYPKEEVLDLDGTILRIRVLELHRWNPFLGVRATLHTTNLDGAPPYKAISYVWGNDAITNTILVNGLPFGTTQATHHLLKGCCHYLTSRYIWIDSVCINQSNDTDRSEQVALMRDIYSNAKQVIVWLARLPEKSSDGQRWWKTIRAQHDEHIVTNMAHQLHDLIKIHGADTSQLQQWFSHERDSHLTLLVDLFANRWFCRVWTVQEVALARDVKFSYEGHPMRWEVIDSVMQLVLKPKLAASLGWPGHPARLAFVNSCLFRVMAELRRDTTKANVQEMDNEWIQLTLSSILIRCAGFHSTDDRDKVYALLGLARDDSARKLRPDYANKTAREVFIDAARYFICSKTPFDVLCYTGIGIHEDNNRAKLELPSWVPDWTCPRHCPALDQPLINNYEKVKYQASGNSQRCMKLDDASETLIVKGACIDQVQYLGSICDFDVEDENVALTYEDTYETGFDPRQVAAVVAWHDEAYSLALKHAGPPKHRKNIDEAFWRTLIGDQGGSSRPALGHFGDSWYASWIRDARALNEYFSRKGEGKKPSLLGAEQANYIWGQSMGYCASGRKFGVTRSGHIGMMPPGAVVGDQIAIFLGSRTPFVVRPGKGRGGCTYALVGECYLDQMMDGEAMEMVGTGQDISLV